MAANRIISVMERTEQMAQMIRTTISMLLGQLGERGLGWRGREAAYVWNPDCNPE